MLEVQKFLIDNAHLNSPETQNANFELLRETYGIKCNFHPVHPMVILNYDQIESPKMEKIVCECRGLVLDTLDYSIIAACMERFFNIGEAEEITKHFVWDRRVISRVKEDGSIITLFWCKYTNDWMVKTRGSWADMPIGDNLPRWDELVFSILQKNLGEINTVANTYSKENSYVFELCSLFNQVVRLYETPQLFLLTVIKNETSIEGVDGIVTFVSEVCGCPRPAKINLSNEQEVRAYIQKLEEEDATNEGIVVRDRNGLRMKVKSATYLAFSRLGNNGNISSDKNLIPLILANEQDEAIAIFPYIEPRIKELKSILIGLHEEMTYYHILSRGLESQKDFALTIKDCKLSSLLFKNRKNGGTMKDLDQLFRESGELFIKITGA
jgi:hypothetical protein